MSGQQRRRSRHAVRLAGVDTSSMTIPEIGKFLGIRTGAAKMVVQRYRLPYKPQPKGGAMQKIKRNGLNFHPRNVASAPVKRKAPTKRIPPRDPKLFGMAAVPSDPNPMGCRFIHGEPGEADHRFCGAMRAGASTPYCPAHHDLTHVPNSTLAEIESARREADRGRAR